MGLVFFLEKKTNKLFILNKIGGRYKRYTQTKMKSNYYEGISSDGVWAIDKSYLDSLISIDLELAKSIDKKLVEKVTK